MRVINHRNGSVGAGGYRSERSCDQARETPASILPQCSQKGGERGEGAMSDPVVTHIFEFLLEKVTEPEFLREHVLKSVGVPSGIAGGCAVALWGVVYVAQRYFEIKESEPRVDPVKEARELDKWSPDQEEEFRRLQDQIRR